MKTNKLIRTAIVLTVFLTAAFLPACSAANIVGNETNNSTAGGETAETENTAEITTIPETAQITSAAEDTVESTTAEDIPWENRPQFRREDNTKIDLFSSAIRDGEGKEYMLNLYMYHIDNGDDIYGAEFFGIKEGMIRGDVAAELLYGGEQVYDLNLILGSIGQVAKSYYVPEIKENFKVLKLDGGDVFVYSYLDEGKDLWLTQFYTVKDGKLKAMERYFSDEERKQIEENTTLGGIAPHTAVNLFITTNKFTTDKNRMIYELDFETPGMKAFSYEIGSYSPGEIPLVFDFEANTVKCEKDEYSGLVYAKFVVV